MSVEWVLYKANPSDRTTIDEEGDEFFPHGADPQDLDAVLVGDFQGPMDEFFEHRTTISNDGSHSIDIFYPDAVKRFAARLAEIKRSDFAPLEAVLRATGRKIESEHQQHFYESLAAKAEKLQEFVADAANRDLAILLEVST